MATFVIYGHGGRTAGTATGTYVIPKGLSIYFYAKDGEILYDSAATVIKSFLLTGAANEVSAQAAARETKTAFETIPNYRITGDANLPDATGIYLVGQPKSAGPLAPIPHGTSYLLSDIIGGASGGGVIGTAIYWLACRAKPDNAMLTDDNADIVTSSVNGVNASCVEQGLSYGLTPSQVKARGGNWR